MSLALSQTIKYYLTKKDIKFIKQTVNDTSKTPTDLSEKYQYIKKLIIDNGGDPRNMWTRDHIMDFFKNIHDKKEKEKQEKELEEAWKEDYAKEWKDTTWEEPVFGETVHKQIANTYPKQNTPQIDKDKSQN